MMATYSSVTGCTVILLAATCGSAIADSGNQDGVTVGIMGENAPRYSGADKQHWTVMPSLQVRKGAFFFDSTKGIGYDLQTDNGLYFENAFGYSFGRADQNSSWRDGSDKLKGMGNIRGALNTQVAVGWQVNSWFTPEIRATLPLTDSQGVQYQASLTLVPWQNDTDTVALQGAAPFGDARYINTWYGVNAAQSRTTGFREYNRSAGFYATQTTLSWQHQFNEHWGTLLGASYAWLADKTSDSPVVSARDNISGFAGINWTF